MILENIEIIDILQDGRGVGKKDGKVYFIEGGSYGETCNIEILEEKKNFTLAKKTKTLQKSKDYREPPCPYYYECGGCSIMDITYDRQIKLKQNLIKNALSKTAGIDLDDIEIIKSKELGYRNKIGLKVGDNGDLAYKKKSSDDLVYINDCLLANDHIRSNFANIQALSKDITEALGHLLSQISIRSNGKQILLNLYTNDEEKVYHYLKNKNIDYKINILEKNKTVSLGEDHLYFTYKDKTFKVSRDDFYQVNDYQIQNLYGEAKKYLGDNKKLLDLFCGSGTSSIAINGDHLVGVEINKSAIADAKENARLNNLTDYKFIAKNAKYIDQKFITKEKIHAVTLDPPRAGIDKEIIKTLAKTKIPQIIYISCNPQTQARDIKRFQKEGYALEKIKAVDMFPQTMHVETIALIQKI